MKPQNSIHLFVSTLLFLSVITLSLSRGIVAQASPLAQPQPLVFTHATLIDLAGVKGKPDMTVVIEGNRIAAVGANGRVRVPRSARIDDSFLSRDVHFGVADEAKKQNLIFAGHISNSVNATEASDAGQKSTEHLTGIITTSDGVKLNVRVSGKGEPCLVVHGGPGQGTASFEGMGGSNLEKYFTMIYLDQRGSGKSASASNYDLDRMIEDIEDVRKKLGYKRLVLLAHSFGGIIALNYTKKYPNRVSKLILANATLHFFSNERLKEQIQYISQLLNKDYRLANGASRKDVRKTWEEATRDLNQSGMGYKLLTENIPTIQKMNSIDRDPKRNHDFGKASLDEEKYPEYYADYVPLTPSIKAPVLVLTGSNDQAVGVNHYRTFRFPKQTVVVIPGGHLSYFDENEMFVQTIRDFVYGKNVRKKISRKAQNFMSWLGR